MAKTHITVSLDNETASTLRDMKINISGTINEMLQNYINQYNNDIEGINIRIEQINAQKYLKKINHYQALLKATNVRIEKYKEMQVAIEESKLKAEKEKIEAQKRCIKCGNMWEDHKWVKFDAGNVCQSCYRSASKEDVKSWMKTNA